MERYTRRRDRQHRHGRRTSDPRARREGARRRGIRRDDRVRHDQARRHAAQAARQLAPARPRLAGPIPLADGLSTYDWYLDNEARGRTMQRHGRRRPPSAHWSPASPARTAPTWPSCCSARATRSTASSAAPSPFNTERIDHLYHDPHETGVRFFGHYGDLTDGSSLTRLLDESSPTRSTTSAAQTHVRVSFDMPEYTADVGRLGALRLLEAMRDLSRRTGASPLLPGRPPPRCTAPPPPPQNETTPFHPRSPYAVAKVDAYWATVNYRESYGLFACNGILFNHESPRRGETFVTRKITRAVGRIAARPAGRALPRQPRRQARLGLRRRLRRGDVAHAAAGRAGRLRGRHRRDAHRARVPARRRSGAPGSTGSSTSTSIRAICRPAEVDHLLGDAGHTTAELGWKPTTSFEQLVDMMLAHDRELARRERTLVDAGHAVAGISGERH